MTAISKLNVGSIRNIQDISIVPHNGLNLLYGVNGSGKTSILEALHVIASGRSFRGSKLDLLIQHGSTSCLVFAELVSGNKVGCVKTLKQNTIVKLDGDIEKNWESVSLLLPTLVLDSNTFLLLDGGPKERRAFLDWGVFHVEPDFLSSWRSVKKCIAHRNLLLKANAPNRDHVGAWDEELDRCAAVVDSYRENYLKSLRPVFEEIYGRLAPKLAGELTISYLKGWDESKSLLDVLRTNYGTDTRYGSTQHGPHRAELLFRLGTNRAIDVMSRGQLKVLVMALKIAQGMLLGNTRDHKCTFLVDDLAAELDKPNRSAVLELLLGSGGQIFVTAVDKTDILECLPPGLSTGTFHVERGTIIT